MDTNIIFGSIIALVAIIIGVVGLLIDEDKETASGGMLILGILVLIMVWIGNSCF